MQWSSSEISSSAFHVHTELMLVTHSSQIKIQPVASQSLITVEIILLPALQQSPHHCGASSAFAGFSHYTTHLAIFPELKLLPFLAYFHDYTMIIYDVIKSSAHLAWCILSGVTQYSALLLGAFWLPSKAMGGQTFSWAAEPKGFSHWDLTFQASWKICLFSSQIPKILLEQQKQNSSA